MSLSKLLILEEEFIYKSIMFQLAEVDEEGNLRCPICKKSNIERIDYDAYLCLNCNVKLRKNLRNQFETIYGGIKWESATG